MPAIIALIAPLIALYLKFKIAGLVFRIVVFDAIYILFNTAVNTMVSNIFNGITSINVDCGIAWVLNDLKLITVLTIYINILLSASSLRLIFSLAIRVPK